MKMPVIRLKRGKERAMQNRHPWLFSGAVKNFPDAPAGAVAEIRDDAGNLLGYGHLTAGTGIVCKVFLFTNEERMIDGSFWQGRFTEAARLREEILDISKTNGYRLINAEGDQLPGMIADVYGDAVSVQVRTEGMSDVIPLLEDFLRARGFKSICISGEEKIGKGEFSLRWSGPVCKETEFLENGYRFLCDIEQGQKTGFFLDQRDNREILSAYSKGRTVLNAFSYSGGFSVFALAGGAKEVVSVDISADACKWAEANVGLNFQDAPHEAVPADVFQYLKKLEQDRFDLIVLDPPAFTKHKSTVQNAARGYKEINLKAMQKIAAGGLIFTFSCSQHISTELFRKIIFSAAADAGREIRILRQLHQTPDHPVSIFHPEGEYLKGMLLHIS